MKNACKMEITNLNKVILTKEGEGIKIIDNLSFSIYNKEILSIIGPSGCGKTTLLKILGGLDREYSGHIDYDFEKSKVSMVFQNICLFHWLTVEENIEFGLKQNNILKKDQENKVSEFLNFFHLEKFKRYYPSQLSGGMQQRVALARTLVLNPNILILDEPFNGLDIFLKEELYHYLFSIKDSFNQSIIIVTHDIDESIYLSDRILVTSSAPMNIKKEILVKKKEELIYTTELKDSLRNLLAG